MPTRAGKTTAFAAAGVAALFFAGLPASLQAQQCVGMPASGGDAFVGGMVQPAAVLEADVQSDGWLGAEAGVDLEGPLSLRGQYRWEHVQRRLFSTGFTPGGADHTVTLLGTADFPVGRISVCPSLGGEVLLSNRESRDVLEIWRVPAGVGVGLPVALGPSVSLTPYAFPQAVLISFPRTVRRVDGQDLERRQIREEDIQGRVELGGVLTAGSFYLVTNIRVNLDFEGSPWVGRALEMGAGVIF